MKTTALATCNCKVTLLTEDKQGNQRRETIAIPPYQTLFYSLHLLLLRQGRPYYAPLILACNGLCYQWNYDLDDECFEKKVISEQEFADKCLIIPNGKGN